MNSSGEWLDLLTRASALCRTYYGDDSSIIPNENCIWQDDGYKIAGWYESDTHFRMRYEKCRAEMLGETK